jgi:hypothetical protein
VSPLPHVPSVVVRSPAGIETDGVEDVVVLEVLLVVVGVVMTGGELVELDVGPMVVPVTVVVRIEEIMVVTV